MNRLISSKYSQTGTVLEDVTEDDADLAVATELDAATNERVSGETRGLAGISQFELVYGIPNAHIIRAAFLHPNKDGGSRFNDTTRGAWYAAEEVDTCIAEVAWHRAERLKDIIDPDEPDEMPVADSATYDNWQADFQADFHVLEPTDAFAEYLQPGPVPECYAAGQALARALLAQRANGVVYPSVRREGEVCLACFRPALVYRPRREMRYALTLTREDREFATHVAVRDPEDDPVPEGLRARARVVTRKGRKTGNPGKP